MAISLYQLVCIKLWHGSDCVNILQVPTSTHQCPPSPHLMVGAGAVVPAQQVVVHLT